MNRELRGSQVNEKAIRHAQRAPTLPMTSNSLGLFCRKLAINLLAAAALVSAQPGYAVPARGAQADVNQSSINESEVKAMVEQAEKLRSEGKYSEAATIWRQLLAISENAFGPDHPEVATSLSNLASLLSEQRQYASAESLCRRSLAIYEKALGADHPYVALSLNNLSQLLRQQGRFAAAEPIARRSLSMSVKDLGPDHPSVAIRLNNLGLLLQDLGRHAEAEPLFRRSLAINEKVYGADHAIVATILDNLAGLLSGQGQYKAAKDLARRALEIREKILGPDHPDVALSLNNLAYLLKSQGQYTSAEALYRRSLAIYEKTLEAGHPDVALSLSNIAALLHRQGLLSAALPLVRRSLSIREKALGPDHPEVATSLNNLAFLLQELGQYVSAEPLFRRSLEINEKVHGIDHPDVALSLGNIANLLSNQGQYDAAEDLHRRALEIQEKALGRDHPDVALSLNNLAYLLKSQGQYTSAEALYRRSLAIYEKTLGADHPDVARSFNNIADLLHSQGLFSAALPLVRRSLGIREKALGPDHPDVARSLNNLAFLLQELGQYASAEPLFRRSLAIKEKVYGTDHPDVAASLNNLASHLSDQGQYRSAMTIQYRSTRHETVWLLRELPLLPDRSRSAQLRQLGHAWEWPFGWISSYPPAAKLALEIRLNRQGLLPEIEQRQALLLNAPGVKRAKVEQLQALTQQLASVSLSVIRRSVLRDERDKLQAEIYRQIPELQLQLVTPAAVAKVLPADGALVEFQRYRPYSGRKHKDKRWGAAQYIALILKPNGSINSVPLGAAAAIDATVQKGLRASADGLSDADAIWAQLSAQVLKPLLTQLTGSRQWFLSPDGELNRVPFAALPAPQQAGKRLAQMVQLRLLTTGRELVRLQKTALPGSTALVMANPNYNRPSTKQPLAARPDGAWTPAQRRSAELGSNQWKPLPGSEHEGQKVAKLLGTGLITGAAATTTALQRQMGPRVLHVATHGFFVADQEAKSPEGLKAIQEGLPLLSSLRQEDPQLRSGLVFAGANQPDLDPKDDGYLTAAEAVNLNLKGTELVVLSACSTGQGEVRTGEGVYGLQRSLTVAGARSTLLSLWKVDDAATAEFMGRYYQRLKSGEGRSDALAAVQEEFRTGKVQSPSGANWKEPYYWAAWQLLGDWRPIRGL
jgi:CHAT domain-containing protein/tetratricopeptide (TPR) repeat protein